MLTTPHRKNVSCYEMFTVLTTVIPLLGQSSLVYAWYIQRYFNNSYEDLYTTSSRKVIGDQTTGKILQTAAVKAKSVPVSRNFPTGTGKQKSEQAAF